MSCSNYHSSRVALRYILQFMSHCLLQFPYFCFSAVHELLLLLQFMGWIISYCSQDCVSELLIHFMYFVDYELPYLFCYINAPSCTRLVFCVAVSMLLLMFISCFICVAINFTVYEHLLQVPCYWGGTVCMSCCWQSMASQSVSTSPLWVKRKLIGKKCLCKMGKES